MEASFPDRRPFQEARSAMSDPGTPPPRLSPVREKPLTEGRDPTGAMREKADVGYALTQTFGS
jgi:hypothetical protein